jgi:hypothetical protein
LIGFNPLLDSLWHLGFKNGGLHPGGDIECFPGPQDIVGGLVGLWATFEGSVSMFWGANFFFFFFIYCSVRTKKLHKMRLKKSVFFLNLIIEFKLELSPQNFHYDILNPFYSDCAHYVWIRKSEKIPGQ